MAVKSGFPVLILGLILLILPASALTPAPPDGDSGIAPAHLSLGTQDWYWVSAAALVNIPAQILFRGMDPVDTGALDRNADLWPMDRWVAGRYSPIASNASQAMILAMGAVPMVASAWDARQGVQSWNSAMADAVVFLEAISLSSALDLIVRSARIHPRPLVYGRQVPARERLAPNASGSFYSGHANGAFLSAVFFAYTYSMRHPDSEYKGWIWAGGLGAAATVAGLRVAAGKHYPSDILVGAATGAFFGWAFPRMHRVEHSGVGLSLRRDRLGVHPQITYRF